MTIETANRLYELRKKHNLSQEELAEKLGVSRQAVSKWERSEASPDTDNLIALACLYGLSLDELIYGKRAEENETAEETNTAKDEAVEDSDEDFDKVDVGPMGIHVETKEGDKVKINLKGIKVVSDSGERVKIGLDGIKVKKQTMIMTRITMTTMKMTTMKMTTRTFTSRYSILNQDFGLTCPTPLSALLHI